MYNRFNAASFHGLCNQVAALDTDLATILVMHGYPPFWTRKPGFATLVHIILEQQVSLASAKAAFLKLEARLGTVTPSGLMELTDTELKDCYFSRQKMGYARQLATAVLSKTLNLEDLEDQPDQVVRDALKRMPGIGNWTVDVYLMMALHRTDCFPTGDIALLKSLTWIKKLPAGPSRDEMTTIASAWMPLRTIAAYLLWHAYLSTLEKRNRAQYQQ